MIAITLLAFLLPLGTRVLVGFVTPGFHEYEALFVYLTDFFVAFLIYRAVKRHGSDLAELLRAAPTSLLFVFVLACGLSVVVAPSLPLALYSFARVLFMIALALSLGVIASREHLFTALCAGIIATAVIQGGLGIAQFGSQSDLGFSKAGEPRLVSYTGAASTITLPEGGRFLRAYGTFPHPNIFAAFMMLGLLATGLWYVKTDIALGRELFSHKDSWWRNRDNLLKALNAYILHPLFRLKLLLVAASWILTLGLIFSFSRSGWVAAFCGLIILSVSLFRYFPGALLRFALMIASCAVIGYALCSTLVLPRVAVERGQPAVDDRAAYTSLALGIASDNPFGIGIGNQVLYGVKQELYQAQGMRSVWKWEPIHSLYLLILTEIGLLGLLSFVIFLAMVLWRLARFITPEKAFVLAAITGLMVAGLFDHYLWTLQPGRLMLWLVLGLALSQMLPSKRMHQR